MDQDTPAIVIKSKDLAQNAQALGYLLARITTPIFTVLDVRFGLGGWAKEVVAKYPHCHIEGYEQDEPTFTKALELGWIPKQAKVYNARFTHPKKANYDMVLADFNVLTALKRALLDDLLAMVKTRWLVFTDVSSSKLHLNFRSYGLVRPDLDIYWQQFKVPGYRLVSWVRTHHAASTALYKTVNKNPRTKSGG